MQLMLDKPSTLTRSAVLQLAWPIILANATEPLLGMVDTAVIGHFGRRTDLAAIALSMLVFNMLYFGAGFLRMGTTGFVAQALGADDTAEVRAVLGRALLLALGIGLPLLVLRQPIAQLAMTLLHGSPEVEQLAARIIGIRLWGAPAVLSTLALRGVLIGLGLSRDLLRLELALNGLNLVLNVSFVAGLGWGAVGVATGTVIAEWAAGLAASLVVWRRLQQRQRDHEALLPWPRMRRWPELRAMISANTDILLRTLVLLFGFALFIDRSARFGDAILAAHHILLQFLSLSAFFLDGYANVAESMVGAALGAGQLHAFDQAVRRTSELALISAAMLALLLWAAGDLFIALLTVLPDVRAPAHAQLPYAACYVLVSVAAFQLDGIFIGTTSTRAMRNAAFAAASLFWITATWWADAYGPRGLWCAFIVFVIARALTLLFHYPALRRTLQ